MFTKQHVPLLVSLGLAAVFVVLLAFNLLAFVLVDFFLMAIGILLLKKHDVKTILLLLSPLVAFLFIFYFFGIFQARLIRVWYIPSLPWVVFALLYAYLFRHYLTKWVEPKARWWAFGIACFLMVLSFLASHVIVGCYAISRAEKGVTTHEIEWCKTWDEYTPTSSKKFSGLQGYLEDVVLWPLVIILAGMLVQFAVTSRKKKSI